MDDLLLLGCTAQFSGCIPYQTGQLAFNFYLPSIGYSAVARCSALELGVPTYGSQYETKGSYT